MKLRRLTDDGPEVPEVCLGTSPLGGMPEAYGYDVTADRAIATVRRAIELGLTFIDTSNEYGDGESERRIGRALHDADVSAGSRVLASKADPVRGARLTGRRVLESFQESTARLGTDFLDVYYLHDPERFEFSELTSPGGALDALVDLKHSGKVGLVGVAGGTLDVLSRFLDTGRLDVVLCHNQFTLLDQSADHLINACLSRGVAFVNAAPYGSGILAKGDSASPRYQYRVPSPQIREAVRWLRDVCADYGVPLAALALQFSTRDPRISSTVVGISSPQRVEELGRNLSHPIPSGLWEAVTRRFESGD